MAEDIKLVWNEEYFEGDISYLDGDLERDGTLTTSVYISMFTDARAADDDKLINSDDKRGWWGDQTNKIEGDITGSKLWLLDGKATQENLIKAKTYTEDCLEWMIEDGAVADVIVKTERYGVPGSEVLAIEVQLLKFDGNKIAFKFNDLWEAQSGI